MSAQATARRTWKAPREDWTKDSAQVAFYRAVGDRVRELRQLGGWSQQMLGTLAGMCGPSIGLIESGRMRASLYNISQLASALGVSVSDLTPSQERVP